MCIYTVMSWQMRRLHKVVTLRYVAIGLTITPLFNNVEQNISNFIMKYEIGLTNWPLKVNKGKWLAQYRK